MFTVLFVLISVVAIALIVKSNMRKPKSSKDNLINFGRFHISIWSLLVIIVAYPVMWITTKLIRDLTSLILHINKR